MPMVAIGEKVERMVICKALKLSMVTISQNYFPITMEGTQITSQALISITAYVDIEETIH